MLIYKIYNLLLAAADAYFGFAKPLAYPAKIHIEVNDFCNLHCVMCGRQMDTIPKNTGEIPFHIIEKLSPFFKRATFVGLAGNGEPFLHSRIFDILNFIIKHEATPSIITNATLLDEAKSQRLTDSGPMLLQVSVDSAVKEIYEKVRIGASFEKVKSNLINLKKLKIQKKKNFPAIAIIACLMRETLPEIEKLADFAHDIGAMEITFQNALPYNEGMKDSLISDLSDGEKAVDKVRERAKKYGININYAPMGFGVERYIGHDPDIHIESFFCENIWDLLHVELSGAVRFCCFWSGEKLGDLNKESPEKIWKSKRFVSLRQALLDGKTPESCRNCYLIKPFDKKNNTRMIFKYLRDAIINHKHFKG